MGQRRSGKGYPENDMIYHKNNLVIKILFENLRKQPVFGISRPQAYIGNTTKYCTVCKFDILRKEIKQGEKAVFDTILEAPKGFGEQLKEGTLLTIKDGLDIIGKAIVLDIIGYNEELQ
jgi:hypothetical protein